LPKITQTNRIAVCATLGTLKSERYKKLKKTWIKDITVIEPDCDSWAELIENGESDKIDVNSVVKSLQNENVDIIVLGCTHFHWLKNRIEKAAGPTVKVLEPSDAVASRTKVG
jgi:glutamate racemase